MVKEPGRSRHGDLAAMTRGDFNGNIQWKKEPRGRRRRIRRRFVARRLRSNYGDRCARNGRAFYSLLVPCFPPPPLPPLSRCIGAETPRWNVGGTLENPGSETRQVEEETRGSIRRTLCKWNECVNSALRNWSL